MQVCKYRGLVLAVLTRNEHCPPHVHVGSPDWEARFKFSFWHNSVCLWDVVPQQKRPVVGVLENLRKSLMQPAHLRKARELWWTTRQTICLEHLQWDSVTHEVVSPKAECPGARAIRSAHFDARGYQTIMQLAGQSEPLEIQL